MLGKHIAGGAGFSTNLLLWQESGYFDSESIRKPLLHLWSLGVEEQFYIVWPPLIWIAIRYCSKFLGELVGAIIVISFAYGLWVLYTGSAAAYYSPLSRFWELVAGSALSVYFAYRTPHAQFQQYLRKNTNVIALLSLGLILGGIFFIRDDFPFPGWWALLPILGTVGLIATSDSVVSTRLLSTRVMVWIGLISYPLYLVHWPIISFFKLITLRQPSLIKMLLICFTSIFLAWLLYRFVERPIRQRGGRITVIILAGLLTLVGGVGYNVYVRHGLDFRPLVNKQLNLNVQKYNSAPADAISCVVTDGSTPEKACLNSGGNKVFIWGDSHTANFYYGLTEAKVSELNIKLLVTLKGGCPPIINYQPKKNIAQNARCDSFVQQSLQQIREFHPDTVVLTAYWSLYSNSNDFNQLADSDIANTIQTLKSLGVKKVIVVGCFPSYDVSLPSIASRVFISGKVDRTLEWLNPKIFEIDHHIADLSNQSGAKFISPLDTLCNKEGCLISTSKIELVPMAYDASHMTYSGSLYFIDHAISQDFFR